MKTVFVYSLNDPTRQHLGKTRYIGKAKDPYRRYEEHLDFNRREKTYKSNWIRSLLALGHTPILEILDEVPEFEWQFWEKEWIRLYRALGFKLTNGTDGGEGLRNPSEEVREKIARTRRGKKLSTAHVAAMSAAMSGEKNPFFGKRHSPETLKKISGKNHPLYGKHHSGETRAKQRAALLNPFCSFNSPESREKMRAATLGKSKSCETREKMRTAAVGRKKSPDHCRRMREGWALRKEKLANATHS